MAEICIKTLANDFDSDSAVIGTEMHAIIGLIILKEQKSLLLPRLRCSQTVTSENSIIHQIAPKLEHLYSCKRTNERKAKRFDGIYEALPFT